MTAIERLTANAAKSRGTNLNALETVHIETTLRHQREEIGKLHARIDTLNSKIHSEAVDELLTESEPTEILCPLCDQWHAPNRKTEPSGTVMGAPVERVVFSLSCPNWKAEPLPGRFDTWRGKLGNETRFGDGYIE